MSGTPFLPREAHRLTAHAHNDTPVGGFVPNRGPSQHNTTATPTPPPPLHLHSNTQGGIRVAAASTCRGRYQCSIPENSLMKHSNPAKEVMGGWLVCGGVCRVVVGSFRWSHLCCRSCWKASANPFWAGNQEEQPSEGEVNKITSAWFAFTCKSSWESRSPGLLSGS